MNEIVISQPVTIIGQGMPIIDGDRKGEIFIIQSEYNSWNVIF